MKVKYHYEVYHKGKYLFELQANNQDEAEQAAVEMLACYNIPTEDYKLIEVIGVNEDEQEKKKKKRIK